MASDEEIVDQQHGFLAQAINLVAPDAIVMQYVAVAKLIDRDGTEVLWTMTSKGSSPWDRLGMLKFALTKEESHITYHEFHEHDD